jgi:hypothetical protein
MQAEIVESVNRARRFFGDPVQRWNDRLILKGRSYVENYRNGNMALILHCNVPAPVEGPMVGVLGEVVIRSGEEFFVVLKADARERHNTEQWNEQLMLVSDVHVVQGPQGPIPSLVGLYNIHDQVANLDGTRMVGETLLFQSAINGSYKFLPLVTDWKLRAVIRDSGSFVESLVVSDVNRASEIMQGISNNKSGIDRGESAFVDVDENMVAPFVFLDADGVKVRLGERIQQLIHIVDVLHGPFNLPS